MKGYSILIVILLLLPCVNAQYWFQSGAMGGQPTNFNSGASVTIQTLTDQKYGSGSIAFWVGEDLQNGAFLQTGYVIENQSGRYPSLCDQNGCSRYEYISAGAPEWFYEYFPPGQGSDFLGAIGPNDSAGKNNTFNTYGFYSNSTEWYFTINKAVVGSVNLGTNTSGYNDVVAFGEVANTSGANITLVPVKFYNLSIYQFGRYVPSPTGYSYIGYGVGSLNDLSNPYGVEELGARADAFEVGSGLQMPKNDYTLWKTSYMLDIKSTYGNISNSGLYIASRTVGLNAPQYVYLKNNTRVEFEGWSGSGVGGYSGQSNDTAVLMYSNITEIANWQLQYLVNVSSEYGIAHGNGWYPANSTAYYSIAQNTVYQGNTSRYIFDGWINGTSSMNGSAKVENPLKIDASWAKQYMVNGSSQYGNVTGTGWYPANSTAYLSVSPVYINESQDERLAFYSWSDGNKMPSHKLIVNKPYDLYASFKNQFLVTLYGIDVYGSRVNAQGFYINNVSEGKQTYLFGGENYTVTGAVYSGSKVNMSAIISTNSSRAMAVQIPLYDVGLSATDIFGVPVSIPVRVKFSNGTTTSLQLNSSGATMPDVPYGRITAFTDYLGLNLSSSAEYGQTARFTVLSAEDMEIFALVLFFAAVMYYISSRLVLGTSSRARRHQHTVSNQ